MQENQSVPSRSGHLTDDQRRELIRQIKDRLEVIYEYMDAGRSKGRKDAINELLIDYPDNAVRVMHHYLMSEMKDPVQLRHRQHFLETLSSPYTWTPSGTTVSEYLTFLPVLDIDSTDPSESFHIIDAIHRMQQLSQISDYTEADPDTKKHVTALLSTTEQVLRHYQRTLANSPENIGVSTPQELGIPLETEPDIRLVGDDLITLLIEHPERSGDITHMIIHQGITNAALLREKLISKTQALRDGII